MTTGNTPTPAELIAEAREYAQHLRASVHTPHTDAILLDMLADYIEAESTRADGMAAILAGVRESIYAEREHASYGKSSIDGDSLAEGIEEVLSESPTDALAAVKEAVWEEGMDAAIEYERGMTRDPKLLDNPYRIEREAQR